MSRFVEQNDKTPKSNTGSRSRDTYASPKLKVFGPVGALTQGGTGIMNESGGQSNPMFQMV